MDLLLDYIWKLWPSQSDMAKDTGINAQNLRMMRHRQTIPVHYWMRLVKAVDVKAPGFLSYEMLVEYHTPKRLRHPPLGSLDDAEPLVIGSRCEEMAQAAA